MMEVGKKSKIKVTWKTTPYDYTEDAIKDIICKFSKKYKIPKDCVSVEASFQIVNEDGTVESINNEIENISDTEFQHKLFKEYISNNKIENIDFEEIKKIDQDITYRLDVETYEKRQRYEIKWVKWDNFLSYGKDNFFDFRRLNGLVLLNGEPSNQSGKTTFAIDLIHFLLFGKSQKAATQDEIFNRWLGEATNVVVEGCICIEGVDYIIKRTLSRPQLKKRTSKSKTTQKVEYYRIISGVEEELEDYEEDLNGDNTAKTNKIIKEVIGSESDFDLVICASSENIDDLIEKKNTERGRILSRWIGLLPIERKEEIAKEIFNKDINPKLFINKFNEEDLLEQKKVLEDNISLLYNGEIKKYSEENEKLVSLIDKAEKTKEALILSQKDVDENVANIDITTLETTIENITNRGKMLKEKISDLDTQIQGINIGLFSEDEYEKLVQDKINKTNQQTIYRNDWKHLAELKDKLEKSEYCPTCGRKFENVDNSAEISKISSQQEEFVKLGKALSDEISSIDKKIEEMKTYRENFNLKSKLTINKSSFEVQIEQLRNELKDKIQLKKDYISNRDAIDKNNQIRIALMNVEAELVNYRNTREKNTIYISQMESEIKNSKKSIKDIEDILNKIKEEREILKNWKLYLEMVGKNGITKMVLRRSLPVINAQIRYLLADVCDFDVEIGITDKNEVNFLIKKDNNVADIRSASGFEKTASALALRFVLAKNSVLPKPNYIVLDEVLSRVANDNLDNISLILERIKKDYSFIFIVTHNEYFKEKANSIITVVKEDNISTLKYSE